MTSHSRKALLVGACLALFGCKKKDAPRPTAQIAAASATADATPPPVYTKDILAPVYHVDRIYKSMAGPQSTSEFHLVDEKNPELLWIVGFEAVMVEKDGKTQASQEWMCHTNLDLDPTEHNRHFGGSKRISGRLFTLSQGQYRIDMPKGYGIPILSTELMSLNTQVLNLNLEKGEKDVRHRVFVRFVKDSEAKQAMKALFVGAAYGLKLLRGKDGVFGGEDAMASSNPSGHEHGQHGQHGSCLPGENASSHEFGDGKGRSFTGHWVVKPGREENHTRVTEIMNLPFDTTLHYVAVHLHPFSESLELKDITANKVVYKALTKQANKGIGLEHVDFFASEDGIPLYKGHEYELISHYNNTTDKDQDSMAVMNLYLHDKEFQKPDLAKVKAALKEKAQQKDAAPANSGKLM
jgi:hypothetical protein